MDKIKKIIDFLNTDIWRIRAGKLKGFPAFWVTHLRLVRQVLFDLTEAGILSEVKLDDGKVIAYQPARDIEDLTIHSIFNLLDHHGITDIPLAETKALGKLRASLANLSKVFEKSPDNLTLKDI